MNSPKYSSREPLPSVDDLQSLVHEAISYETLDFNRAALRLTGQWYGNVEDYLKTSTTNLRQEPALKLWQIDDEPIAKRVLVKTEDFGVAANDDELIRIPVTTFTELGMTSLNGNVGIVFVTAGDISDDLNEALYIPKTYSTSIRISS